MTFCLVGFFISLFLVSKEGARRIKLIYVMSFYPLPGWEGNTIYRFMLCSRVDCPCTVKIKESLDSDAVRCPINLSIKQIILVTKFVDWSL